MEEIFPQCGIILRLNPEEGMITVEKRDYINAFVN